MQMIAFLIVLALFIILFSATKESLEPKIKIAIAIGLGVVVFFASIYEFYFDNKRLSNRQLVNSYEQGLILNCNDKMVDNKHYVYESGTQSFVAKSEFKDLSGVVIPLKFCKEK